MYSEKAKEYYSYNMIMASLHKLISFTPDLQNGIVNMMLFDFLIGNTDRHQHNWGMLLQQEKDLTISPLYDNSSSLCAYVKDEDITNILRDSRRFQSLVESKSTSRIRINGKSKKEPKHSEVVSYFIQNQIDLPVIDRIIESVNKDNLYTILGKYDTIINSARIELIEKYLLCKIDILKKAFYD